MGVRVLFADPSEEWLNEAGKFFRELGYEVDVVLNGKQTQLAVYNNKYFAVFLNLGITNHSGTQVLKFIKTNYPGIKVIIIAESEQIFKSSGLKTSSLHKQGVFDIFTERPTLKVLQTALEGHQDYSQVISQFKPRDGASEEVEVSESDSKFTSVPIDEFVSTQAVQFDLYIRLSSGKYIKILHAGDSFSKDRISKYKDEKGLTHLHFLKEDRRKFVRMNTFLTEKIAANPAVSAAPKFKLLKNVTSKFTEEIVEQGIQPLAIEQGKQICNSIYDTIHSDDQLFMLLRNLQEFNADLYTHSFLVTFFASMLVKQFEWDSRIVNETIGLAGIFHDIGFVKLPPELVENDESELSEEQLGLYKQHPQKSYDLLSGVPFMSAAAKQIVYQHHERINGSGYPHGLKKLKILILAQILGLADDFVKFIQKKEMAPPDALKSLLMNPDVTSVHSSIIIEKFLRIFIDPKKIMP